MEKNKLSFKERFNAFLEYWRENWIKDCIFGLLCIALGFCIARCTPGEVNTASADTGIDYAIYDASPEEPYVFSLVDSPKTYLGVSYLSNLYQWRVLFFNPATANSLTVTFYIDADFRVEVLSPALSFSLTPLPSTDIYIFDWSVFGFLDNYDFTSYSYEFLSISSDDVIYFVAARTSSYDDGYSRGYNTGYNEGYSEAISSVNSSYQSAYNDGYYSAYNTISTLSPNYVAGYDAGLSNADGSWVLSPVNAVNAFMSLELFSVGDFHFKLSYLVYLSIGGLLVSVLLRFLFHS